MFDEREMEENLGVKRVEIVPATNLSAENANTRKRIESYKENRRREMLAKYATKSEAISPKSSGSSKRKEDLRGGGGVAGPIASSCLRSRTSENQVPSSDQRRYISRRDQNKTDANLGINGEAIVNRVEAESHPVPVTVRETRTSRLRALNRSSSADTNSMKNEKSGSYSPSSSSTTNSFNRKEIDKSHKRKSYLNRSNTSDEVNEDVLLPGDSLLNRRRSTKTAGSYPKKSEQEETLSSTDRSDVSRLSNGSITKETLPKSEKLSRPLSHNRNSLYTNKKPLSGSDRSACQSMANGDRNPLLKRQKSVENRKTEPSVVAESRAIVSHLRRLEDRFQARRSSDSAARAVTSSSNSPVKRNSIDKSHHSPDDFAKRAEALAATTLKMITRLDEINKKNTRADKNQCCPSRKSSEDQDCSDRFSFEKVLRAFDSGSKAETKKLTSPDDNTAKSQSSSSVLTRRSSFQKIGTANSKPSVDIGKLGRESPKSELKKSDSPARPSSILKKKVTSDSLPSSIEIRKSKPVSILKRKSLSQDESHSKTNLLLAPPPVTFSPSVLDRETKRQGILKKRRSLDENEVLRRHHFSPEPDVAEFKPILKNQRRSSFEDLSGRSRSPDNPPQSILKRKSSREEETEELTAGGIQPGEPQGILKRKSISGGPQHVKIADAVAGATEILANENVRPILKKKSSSEEHSTPELSLTDPPKPILKKKSSLEVDEMEDKPKKPILKTSRKTSLEDPDEGKQAWNFAACDAEPVKPILKRDNSRSKLLVPDSAGDGVVPRRLNPNRSGRPSSFSEVDDELHAVFNKIRSLDFHSSTNAVNSDWGLRRAKSVSLSERMNGDLIRRPSSVAERVNTLENFLQMERERRNTLPESPSGSQQSPNRFSPRRSPTGDSSQLASGVTKFCVGALVTRPNEISSPRFPCNRSFSDGASSSSSPTTPNHPNSDEEARNCPQPSGRESSESDEDVCRCRRKDSLSIGSPTSPVKLKSIRETEEAKSATSLFNNNSYHSTDSEISSNGLSNDHDDSEYLSAVESCTKKLSNTDINPAEENGAGSMEEAKEVAEEIFLLQKSGSVTATASIFQEMEKKFKAAAEEEKTKPTTKAGNRGINRYREKKLLESNPQKYHTQPISSQDVEKAIRNTKNALGDKSDDAENFEDELSSMSLSDRVRLFNEKILKESTTSPPPPGPTPTRKRGPRFRTQPVTTAEVETAQGQQRLSPLAASLMRPPDPDLFGLGILSAQSIKEKMYDHANACVKGRSVTPTGELVPDASKRKGILKNSPQREEGVIRLRKQSTESDSSDSEIKSILRSDPNEGLLRFSRNGEKESVLRGILKQPSAEKKATPSSEESSFTDEEGALSSTGHKRSNLASILQSVEPVKIQESKTSDGEDSSSCGREVHRFVKNEAVARRRQSALNKLRNNSSLVKSQSHSAVSSICRPPGKAKTDAKLNDAIKSHALNGKSDRLERKSAGDCWKDDETDDGSRFEGLKRSTTQPLGGFERQADDDMSGASIQERLARLKKSGENDWQKRKSHNTSTDEFSIITSGNYLFNETCMLRNQRLNSPPVQKDGSDDIKSSASILADRLDKLDAAKEGWRKRVPPSDAVQFSVEGKMLGKTDLLSRSPLQVLTTRAPLAERKKRCPKPIPFRSRKNQPSLNSVPSSPMEVISNPIARSVSAPGSGQDGLFSLSNLESTGPVVSVPKTDDETFTAFFNGLCSDVTLEERLEINDEDLDVVSKMQSSQLLVQKKNIKIQRRRATLKNPLKTLAARNDLQEYTEIKTGIAEKELKRLKVEKASKNSSLAIEALAGLASQEDFTAINLKKASDGGINSPAPPFKTLMLLQVKGRRHVQTRMVEPVARSINSGDCFILVTPKKVFHYVGEYANVIEKSRGAEISLLIQQNSDLGCTTNAVITIGGGGRATSEQIKEFWGLLGDDRSQERRAGHPDEDEIFESAIIDTNMIYEVVNDELVPVEGYWGSLPRIELLNSNKVLVFDFGSEFYVWIGKNVNIPDRKIALKLARELWEEGYDYTECDLCPLSLDSYFDHIDELDGIPESNKAGPVRPDWALFAKITENMETVLFREKFLDWPDYSRVIRRSKKDEESEHFDGNGVIEAKPCDAKSMLEHVRSEPDLVLEGNHLGRGIRYFEEETRRCAEVTTRDVTVWHISEYEYSEMPAASVGQFHMEDSYVVRWHYLITITGRELSGQPSKHLTVGRDRFAYFCWQGRDSPINDKGAAACLTVELDKEHGPQVRVIQGFEPPAFLNLFRGSMVVHSGRRDSSSSLPNWRMFVSRGEDESESVLFEVPTSMRQLRSAASFVLVNNVRCFIIVWHGLKSPEHARKISLTAAKHIQSNAPAEFSFKSKDIKIREEVEGSESVDFIRAVGGEKRQLYYSFLDNKHEEVKTLRLFHLSSVSGEFLFSEISPPSFNKEVESPYPFLQEDLYSAPQPALFMIDTGYCLWLWQGWWEAESGEGDRGSGILRFQAERRAAMTTAVSYWNLKYGNTTPKAYLVWAGLEPLVFTNLFPIWTDQDQISEINMKEGRKPGEIVLVKTELASLTQSTYPLAQLQSRPLPDGVNPSFLEDYLEPQCFQTLFGMTVEEFYNLPSWKKKKLKQDVGLF